MSATGDSTVTGHSDHHVHFDAASLKDDFDVDNSSVTYQPTDDGIIVNLGFLQIKHKYEIDLKLPSKLFGDIKEDTLESSDSSLSTSPSPPILTAPGVSSQTVPNLHCKITDFSGYKSDKNDYFEMKIEFSAYKEKLIKEQLIVVNSKNSKEIFKLIITARVLGKGKGTPMLKNGIHCIGVDKDYESESDASDFSAFHKSH